MTPVESDILMMFGKFGRKMFDYLEINWSTKCIKRYHFVVHGLYNTIASQHLNFDVYVLITPYVFILIMIKIYSTALLNTAFSH